MLSSIDTAVSTRPANLLAQHHPIEVSEKTHTGKRGRPGIEIDAIALQQLLELRGPEGTAMFLGCSTRTVRRRALDLGLVCPGRPVFTYENQPDGTISKVYHRREEVHSTDEEVHIAVAALLETYPEIGREKMVAAVKVGGVSATRRQVEAALLMLRGPSNSKTRKPIQRRMYTVPGSNYMWHHDGQHGWYFVCYQLLGNSYSFRSYPLETRHPRLRRRSCANGSRNPGQPEQSFHHRAQFIPRCNQ